MREEKLSQVREREQIVGDHLFCFSGFTTAIGAYSTSKEFVGFSPLWFPRGKLFVSLVSYVYYCACYSLN